jgi:hypothetical protein
LRLIEHTLEIWREMPPRFAAECPQAIFTPVSASAMSAYDWVSLPVPAVVGTAIIGNRVAVAFASPQ